METLALEMRDIRVEFPGVKALSGVDFCMERGKIHALIGANGAGKSTLMKVLSGVNSHYSGTIFIDGEEQRISSPRRAKELGIETVYQEVDTCLCRNLSVAENIMAGFLVKGMGRNQFVNWAYINTAAEEALFRLNVKLDVRKPVGSLSLAEKQMVLVARAVREKCKFLVLDEPTAPLSRRETENLFTVVRRLAKEENVGIVFISHRLAELFEICEYITILRDGQVVQDREIGTDLTVGRMIEYMLGRRLEESYQKNTIPVGDVLLELENLTEAEGRVQDININVRRGEIVGIAGLVGAGKTELCKTIFGAFKIGNGKIKLNNKDITPKSPAEAVKQGFALVPEERRKEGIFIQEPVYTNIAIASLHKLLNRIGLVSKRRQKESARKMIDILGIKARSVSQPVNLLSGGNQQKTVVAKWLVSDSEVYIFDEPTKGVDVGAKRDIFVLIEELASRGKGIIYASCEFPEILAIADRAYVMFDGKIVREVRTLESDEKELLYYATGGN
jgi:simple sugar transport system ATP-binding protein